jgi:hypothetical protein
MADFILLNFVARKLAVFECARIVRLPGKHDPECVEEVFALSGLAAFLNVLMFCL